MSYDRTFCAAKCINAVCEDNRIHTAGARKNLSLSWYDPSKTCASYQATDTILVDRLPIEKLAELANKAMGLSWETGEAFHELAFKVAYRLEELKGRTLTEAQRKDIEDVMDRLRLKKSGLPWVEGNE